MLNPIPDTLLPVLSTFFGTAEAQRNKAQQLRLVKKRRARCANAIYFLLVRSATFAIWR